MSLEPISYTLGIFKRIVCNVPIAWRVLGYIPNTEKVYHIRYPWNKIGGNLKKKTLSTNFTSYTPTSVCFAEEGWVHLEASILQRRS